MQFSKAFWKKNDAKKIKVNFVESNHQHKLHRYYYSSTKCPILSSDIFFQCWPPCSSRTCKFFTFHSFLPRPKYSFQFVCTKVFAADENNNSSCHRALNLSSISIYMYSYSKSLNYIIFWFQEKFVLHKTMSFKIVDKSSLFKDVL